MFSGFIISFIGALPLGSLNITAFQIAATQSVPKAILFAVAVVLVEILIVRITLLGSRLISIQGKLIDYLVPAAIILLIYLSVSNFISASYRTETSSEVILFPAIKSTFILGLVLSFLNPMQVPFWLSWNSILQSKNKLQPTAGIYLFYLTGIALGSLIGLLLFILSGKILIVNYQKYSYLISVVIGVLYLGLALYLMFKFYFIFSKKAIE